MTFELNPLCMQNEFELKSMKLQFYVNLKKNRNENETKKSFSLNSAISHDYLDFIIISQELKIFKKKYVYIL